MTVSDPLTPTDPPVVPALPVIPAISAPPITPDDSQSTDDTARPRGVPGWIVLAAVVIALGVSVFIVTQIGSSLSALVSPPEPVLPPQAVLQSQGSDHVGDYWVYETARTGCLTAKFYQDLYGHCTFSPASGCQPDGSSRNGYIIPGPMTIAQCNASQVIGQYHINWQINISIMNDNKSLQSAGTTFRISRDLG